MDDQKNQNSSKGDFLLLGKNRSNPGHNLPIIAVIGLMFLMSPLAWSQTSSTTVSPSTTQSNNETGVAAAPQSVAESTSQTSSQQPFPLSIFDLSFFYGPSVSDPASNVTADNAVGELTGLSSRHNVFFNYKLNSKTSIMPVLDFNYQFTDPITNGQRRGFSWNDSFIAVTRSNVAKANLGKSSLGLNGDFRYYVPTSQTARDGKTIGALRLTVSPTLQFGSSPFSISMDSYFKFWIQTQETGAGNAPLRRFEFYTGPQLNFQASDRVTAFVLFEAVTSINTLGASDLKNTQKSLADIEPGVNVKINDNLTLTPFINWYTNQSISTASWNLMANIKAL